MADTRVSRTLNRLARADGFGVDRVDEPPLVQRGVLDVTLAWSADPVKYAA